jgi:hypothetical protein
LGAGGGAGLVGQGGFGFGARGLGTAGSGAGAGVIGIFSSEENPYGPDAGAAFRRLTLMRKHAGVFGTADSDATGVHGDSEKGYGVFGTSKGDLNQAGVRGECFQGSGVYGKSSEGAGVQGYSTDQPGVLGESQNGVGVSGIGLDQPGVLGESQNGAGVSGTSVSNAGVQGQSINGVGGVFWAGGVGIAPADTPRGRAGVFLSDSSAQVRLVPHKAPNPLPQSQAFTVQALITKGVETELPANGQTGDLLCTMMSDPQAPQVEVAALWFCERRGENQDNPATWRQVLLGPAFFGQG